MSWLNLSGNLSSVTNSISSFTREVLVEVGSEADNRFNEEDAEEQLHSAEYTIRELETKLLQQRSELERVNRLNEELQERAESAEIQIQAISTQYKGIIHEKDVEIQIQAISTQYKGIIHEKDVEILEMKSSESTSVITYSSSRQRLDSLNQAHPDEDDPFMLQMRIETLLKERNELQDECIQWKEKASMSPSSDGVNVDELRESHRQEMASVLNTHNQRIGILKKKHKIEMRNLQQKLDSTIDSENSGCHDPADSVGNLKLLTEEIGSKDSQIASLQEEIKCLNSSAFPSDTEISKLEEENTNLKIHLEAVIEEMETLKSFFETKELMFGNEHQEHLDTLEDMRRLKEELQGHAETAEIQIQAISTQYKGIIQEKEVQLETLLNGQTELQDECNQWKEKAAMSQSSDGVDVDELRESHRHEIESILNTHNQRIAILKKKHKIEMRNLQQKLYSTTGSGSGGCQNPDDSVENFKLLTDEIGSKDSEIASLKEEINCLNSSLTPDDIEISKLEKHNTNLQINLKAVPAEMETPKADFETKEPMFDVECQEHLDTSTSSKGAKVDDNLFESHRQEMTSALNTHNQRIAILKKKHKIEMRNLQHKLDSITVSENSGHQNRDESFENLKLLTEEIRSKDSQIASLQEEIKHLNSFPVPDDIEITKLEKHNTNLKIHLEAVTEEMETSKAVLETQELMIDNERQEHLDTISRQEQTITNLQKEINSLSSFEILAPSTPSRDVQVELERSRSENIELSNELQMKEIAVNSIERLIQENGGEFADFEISDFENWYRTAKFPTSAYDHGECAAGCSDTIENVNVQLELYRGEMERLSTMVEAVEEGVRNFQHGVVASDFVIDQFSTWLSQLNGLYTKMKDESKSYKDSIELVENCIQGFDSESESFVISEIDAWLQSVREKVVEIRTEKQNIIVDEDNKAGEGSQDVERLRAELSQKTLLLVSIQDEVRNLDDDYKDFEVEGFNEWLENYQTKMDDLAEDLLCEQENREQDELAREEERTQLNNIFMQKQREIAGLKVELYKLSSANRGDEHVQISQPVDDCCDDHDSYMSVSEKMMEAHSRCEGFSVELSSMKNECDRLKSECDHLKNQRDQIRNEYDPLQNECDQLQNESDKLRKDYAELQKECAELQNEHEVVKIERDSTIEEMNAGLTECQEIKKTNEQQRADLAVIAEFIDLLDCHLFHNEVDSVLDVDAIMQSYERKEDVERLECLQKLQNILKAFSTCSSNLIQEAAAEDHRHIQVSSSPQRCNSDERSPSPSSSSSVVSIPSYNELDERLKQAQQELVQMNCDLVTKVACIKELLDKIPLDQLNVVSGETIQKSVCLLTELTNSSSERDSNDKINQSDNDFEETSRTPDQVVKPEKIREENSEDTDNELDKRKAVMSILCKSIHDIFTSLRTKNPLYSDQSSLTLDLVAYNTSLETYVEQESWVTNYMDMFRTLLYKVSKHNSECLTDAEKWKNLYDEALSNRAAEQSSAELEMNQINIELTMLRTQKIVLDDHVEMLKQELENLSQNYQYCACERDALQAELDKLQFQLDTNETDDSKEISELKSQLDDLKRERENLMRMVVDRDDSLLEQQDQFDAFTDKIVAEKTQSIEDITNKQSREVDALQSELDATREAIVSRNEANRHLEVNVSELKQELEMLNTEVQKISGVGRDQTELSTHQDVELEQLKLLLGDAQAECSSLHQRLSQLTEQDTELFDRDLAQRELDQLKHIVHTGDEEVKRLSASLIEAENAASDMILVQQECHQLKQLLTTQAEDHRDRQAQVQQLEDECARLRGQLVSAENESSDMALLREECQQLKAMLMDHSNSDQSQSNSAELEEVIRDRDARCSHLQAVIVDLQNEISDMQLLREECSQLKRMLQNQEQTATSTYMPTADENGVTSLLVEENTRLKIDSAERDYEFTQLRAKLEELNSNSTSSRNECDQLKLMIGQQEQELVALRSRQAGSEQPTSNQVNEQYNAVVVQYNTLVQHYQALQALLTQKEQHLQEAQQQMQSFEQTVSQNDETIQQQQNELQTLRDELSHNASQIENLVILQSEYRAVEEKCRDFQMKHAALEKQLQIKEREVEEMNEALFSAETRCERMSTNEDQFNCLKAALAERESELTALRLSTSENSILESDTVLMLQEGMNQLKILLFNSENEMKNVVGVLQKREMEIHQLQLQVEELNAEGEKLQTTMVDKVSYEGLQTNVMELETKLKEKEESFEEKMKAKGADFETTILEKDAMLKECRNNIDILNTTLHNEEKKVAEREASVRKAQEMLDKYEMDKLRLEGYYEELRTTSECNISRLSAQLRELEVDIDTLEATREELALERKGVEAERENSNILEKIIKDLQHDANHLKYELEETMSRLHTTTAELEKQKELCEEQKLKLCQNGSEIEELHLEQSKLVEQAKCTNKQDEISFLLISQQQQHTEKDNSFRETQKVLQCDVNHLKCELEETMSRLQATAAELGKQKELCEEQNLKLSQNVSEIEELHLEQSKLMEQAQCMDKKDEISLLHVQLLASQQQLLEKDNSLQDIQEVLERKNEWIENAKMLLSAKEEETSKLRGEICGQQEALQCGVDESAEQIRNLKETMTELESKYNDKLTESRSLEEENSSLKTCILDYEAENTSLENKVNGLEIKCADKTKQYNEYRLKVQEVKAKWKEERKQLRKEKRDQSAETGEGKIKILLAEIEDKDKEIDEIRKEMESKESHMLLLDNKIDELLNEIHDKDDCLQELDNGVKIRDDKISLLEINVKESLAEIKEKDEELSDFVGKAENKDRSTSLLTENLERLSHQLQAKDDELTEIRMEMNAKDKDLAALDNKTEGLLNEITEKGNKLFEQKQGSESKNTQILYLEENLHKLSKAIQEKDGDLVETRNVLCNRDGQVLLLNNKIQELLSEIEDKDKELRELHLKNDSKSNETSLLDETIQKLSHEIYQKDNYLCEISQNLEAKDKQIASLDDKVKAFLLEVQEKDEQIWKLGDEVNSKKNNIEQLSLSMDTLKDVLELRNTELDTASLQVECLKSDLENMKSEHLVKIKAFETEFSCQQSAHDEACELLQLKENEVLDIRSQLIEESDFQMMYSEKCVECDAISAELDMLRRDVHNQEEVKETEKLQELQELEKTSKRYLEKAEECDQNRVTVIELEKCVFELTEKLSISTDRVTALEAELTSMSSNLEETLLKIASMKTIMAEKNARIDELESEDEKQISEDSMKNQTRIRELELTVQQRDARVQELEVQVRHQDVHCREIEVKTARDLDRLRNHLISTEEAQTKEIIEAQAREKKLTNELNEVNDLLSQKSHTYQNSSDEFHSHVSDLEEQLKALSVQRDQLSLELSRQREKNEANGTASRNLERALAQLQREKEEQYEYLSEKANRELSEAQAQITQLRNKDNETQERIQEAALAVQGVAKLSTDIQKHEEQTRMYQQKVSELSALLQEREQKIRKFAEVHENKLDKEIIKNLLTAYFNSSEEKRSAIIHVIGGLLGFTNNEINEIGTGAPRSKSGSLWGVFSFGQGSPRPPETPTKMRIQNQLLDNSNHSFSELFVNFLEKETENGSSLSSNPLLQNQSFSGLSLSSPAPSDEHNKTAPLLFSTPPFSSKSSNSSKTPSPLISNRIPAPGQEVPRVHTHQANSTLKTLLAT